MQDAEEDSWSLSRELLDLLRMLGDPVLLAYLKELWSAHPVEWSAEEGPAIQRGQELMRLLAMRLVETKLEPTLKASQLEFGDVDLPLELLRDVVADAQLDEYFTRQALSAVPAVVFRWKELRELLVAFLPDERVRRYLREATTCYLLGLPGAAAVLCRAALESALADVLVRRDVSLSRALGRRLGLARQLGVLTREMAKKAYDIQDVGDEAIHNLTCSEPAARDQIRRTAEVLQHLYSPTRLSESAP